MATMSRMIWKTAGGRARETIVDMQARGDDDWGCHNGLLQSLEYIEHGDGLHVRVRQAEMTSGMSALVTRQKVVLLVKGGNLEEEQYVCERG